MKKLLAKIRKILKDRRTRQLLTRIVSITAAVVVFITTYALVLPAITMESEANCGIPAHQHDDSCYEDRLICGQVESPGHQHTDACYSLSQSLICTETEHQHDDSCFDADGNLTCELAEHTHDDSCYEEVRELVCDIPESEGHEHTDDCYERVLACGMEAHTHSTACYSHDSELTVSAPSDFAAVATTELGSYGATVSPSTETDTDSEETSNTWASDESAAGGLSSTAAGAAAADYSSTATAAGTASTGFDAATAEDAFIPQLEPIYFEQLLTKDTDIYYYHAEEGEEVPENSADIADWKHVDDDTELAPADLLRVYLRYTIPAGALNATNDIARYRLPSNLHLTDQQMEAINTTVNGIANQYVNLDTLEITDTERYNTYLGIEATEGTRKPSDNIEEYFTNHPDLEGQEYINAVVRAENVFDETTEEYLGQNLVFTFTPYTVQKNQHEYDAEGQPTKAGQKVNGWLCFDLHMDQIDWSEPVVSTIEDPAAPAQDVAVENTEDTESSDTAEATEKAASADMDEEASLSSSNPEALNTNTLTEKTESSAEIVFATKDNALKIDEISTELHQVELNTIEKENDAAQDEPDQSADDSTDNANPEMTDGKDDTADDSIPEGEADKSESTDESAADTENQPESAMEINAETYPAVSFEDTITVQAGTLSTDNESAAKSTPAETAITVSVIAEEETFPLGTTMQLGTVEDMDTVASAVEGTVEGQTRGFHAVDISFHNADGEEIEPLKPIKVSMTSEAIKQAVEDSSTVPVVVHVENPANNSEDSKDSTDTSADTSPVGSDKNEKAAETEADSAAISETGENTPAATIIETNETFGTNNSNKSKEAPDTLSFDADTFSVYAIVYTVDFHYEVNGKMYEFSIPGGGFVSLEHVVEVLGIATADENGENGAENAENGTENGNDFVGEVPGVDVSGENEATLNETPDDLNETEGEVSDEVVSDDANEAISEETKNFVADVESVEFSNPDFLWVRKVLNDTTVRELKEENELEIRYSNNLTVKDVAWINAQTVDAGDWALISVQPFTSEETLTVTMKNGDTYDIRISGNVSYGNEKIQYSSADGAIVVTAVAPVGVLPAGTKVQVRDIAPCDEEGKEAADEEAQLYADAINAVADSLKEKETMLNGAKVCDITFVGADGKEIEPEDSVDISISFKDSVDLSAGEEDTANGVAHIKHDGNVEVLNADIDENDNGVISETVFSSDEFSVYVVFNGTSTTQSAEPVYLKNGWIRIGGDYKQANALPNGLHTADDENGWKNYIKVNLYTLKAGKSQNSKNTEDYDLTSTFSWVAGYDTLTIEDYEFNGNVVFTQFDPADRDIMDPVDGLAKGQTFPARTAFHNWGETTWEVFENVLNIYVNTTSPSTQTGTDYVIRYYHADGSYHEETGTLTSGSKPFSYTDKLKQGEVYSGITLTTGNDAVSSLDTANGSITIKYLSGTPVVKANIYYKEDIQKKTGGTVTGTPQYDATGTGSSKVYDTSRLGLHTDKTASVTSNSSLNDGRTFDLTLETWNVGNSYANVGMVLDASGSMVWTSDTPTVIQYSDAEWREILGGYRDWSGDHYYYDEVKGDQKILNPDLVNKILNTANCDYSNLNYNGYKYYILDQQSSVKEYVPLGYYSGGTMSNYNGHKRVCADNYYLAALINDGSQDYDATAGWYYINSTDRTWYRTYGTAKSYANYPASYNNSTRWWSVDGYNNQTSTKFYIDSNGKLHCKFWRSNAEWSSDVYMNANDNDTKSEVLQHSIARFSAILNALYPSSQMAMTRFSRNDFTSAELALLNWTNNTSAITAALNQEYNASTTSSSETQYSLNGTGLSVYNYGFTGGTSTKTGLKAFIDDLTTASNSYAPKTTNNADSKYLIIFTDGKDTDGASTDTSVSGSAAYYAKQLKDNGYTIFTVLMQSAGMTTADVNSAKTFLTALAGTKTESGDNYYFSAMYNDPEALVQKFETIAKKIAKPLEGYMIRDYIDPRFDLLDNEGNVLTQLNPQGKWSPRTITTADGKRAVLKYDSTKGMFYLEIDNQQIPTTPRNATNDITVNSTKITVRAKSDFIGGEDILTNGNEAEQNSVFKPVDGYSTQTDAPTQANPSADKKDFPKTTTNPATLNISLANYEDIIFLGEEISPASLYESVQIKRDNAVDYRSVYFNYLVRAGEKFQGDPTYYVNLMKYGTVPTGATNNDPSKDKDGNNITDFEFVKDTNGVTMLTLPYYYLENPGDVTSYAGGTLHQADKVGTVTYSWKALDTGGHTLTDNNALNDYESTTLNSVKYQLSVSYTPDEFVHNDSITDNGSSRTLALTEQTGTDKLIKDPVGSSAQRQVTDTETQGFAVIHVVAGKFKVIKRIEISDTDWTKLVTNADDDGLTFTFQLKQDGENYGDPFTINTKTATKSENGDYIELSSEWIDNLPKGNYTVEETAQPSGFTFQSVSIATVTLDDADALRAGGTPFSAPTTSTPAWEIGTADGGVPSASTYSSTDFSYTKVTDTNKEVDPNKSKAYLNAQIGKGIIENEPPKVTDITLKKVDKTTGESIGGAKFSLIKGSEYVDLESYTITKLVSTEDDPVVETITVGSNNNVKVVTVPKGGIKIEGLADGTYTLKEMAAPAGYIITDNGVEFTTENGALKNHTDAESGINFKVENEPGAALPNTGGPGTTTLYLLGIMLTTFAGAGLVMRKRRRDAA